MPIDEWFDEQLATGRFDVGLREMFQEARAVVREQQEHEEARQEAEEAGETGALQDRKLLHVPIVALETTGHWLAWSWWLLSKLLEKVPGFYDGVEEFYRRDVARDRRRHDEDD